MNKKLPKIINKEEFEQLFTAIYNKEKRSKGVKKAKLKKYRVAVLLGFEAGLRISEIVGYKDKVPPLDKPNVDDVSIRIENAKGGKDRIVPRPKRFNDAAKSMLPLNISRRALQRFIKQAGKRYLDKDIHFHTLRHSFGTHLANQNRPLHEIQMLMGHNKLETTGIYLHASPDHAIREARDTF